MPALRAWPTRRVTSSSSFATITSVAASATIATSATHEQRTNGLEVAAKDDCGVLLGNDLSHDCLLCGELQSTSGGAWCGGTVSAQRQSGNSAVTLACSGTVPLLAWTSAFLARWRPWTGPSMSRSAGASAAPCSPCCFCTERDARERAADRRALGREPARERAEDAPGARLAAAQGAARPGVLVTRGTATSCSSTSDELDAHRFERLLEERQGRAGGRPSGPGARGARALAGPVARPAARRSRLRAVRADRDRPARGPARWRQSSSRSRRSSSSAATAR